MSMRDPNGYHRLPPQPRFVQPPPSYRGAGVVPTVDVGPRIVDGAVLPVQETADAQFVVAIPGVSGWYPSAISTAMDAGQDSTVLIFRFLEPGIIQYVMADVVGPSEMETSISPEEARTLCGISIVDGVTNAQLMNNGNGEQPMTVSQLMWAGVVPMQRRVGVQDTWRVKFTNFSTENNGLRAQCTFGFLADARTIRK